MLKEIFKELDHWMEIQNEERRREWRPRLPACEIRVVGQTALIEAQLSLHVPATMDVDVFANYEYPVQKRFEELLKEAGKVLDPVGHEAWMPEETQYLEFFKGIWVTAFLARAEYVMIAKAKKAPSKNKSLILEYLASRPPEEFFVLARKYKVDLDSFSR